jgi:hypothetical protein
MIRSTLRSFSFGIIAAVFSLSLSPLNGVAHADPGVGRADQVDIIYGDGDEGAIYIGPVTATPHQPTSRWHLATCSSETPTRALSTQARHLSWPRRRLTYPGTSPAWLAL